MNWRGLENDIADKLRDGRAAVRGATVGAEAIMFNVEVPKGPNVPNPKTRGEQVVEKHGYRHPRLAKSIDGAIAEAWEAAAKVADELADMFSEDNAHDKESGACRTAAQTIRARSNISTTDSKVPIDSYKG